MPEFPIPSAQILLVSQIQGGGATAPPEPLSGTPMLCIAVKLTLFKTYCLCLYDTALLKNFSATVYRKLKSAYNKCIKKMFGYTRRDSMTDVFFD